MPGIDQLLIQSALDAELRRRLRESPDEVFQEFDLTEEERDVLRRPDHRLLPLLGAALTRQARPSDPDRAPEVSSEGAAPHAVIQARTLSDLSLALAVVPCVRAEDGQATGISYAVWVNPLAEGVDPSSLPPPSGASLPGQPLAPLHVVLKISAIQLPDAGGWPQVGLSASLRQSSNIAGPPLPGSAGAPESAPQSDAVRAAVAAVRAALPEERYGKLIALIRAQR